MASVEIFNCFGKIIIRIFDCSIRVTCSNLTVLIEYLDFDHLPEASKDGLDLPLHLEQHPLLHLELLISTYLSLKSCML